MFGDPVLNPNNYPVHQLSDYIEFLTSGSRGWAQYCVDDGAEWFITIKNVKDCRISVENIQPISVPDNAEARRTRVQEGDLLISFDMDAIKAEGYLLTTPMMVCNTDDYSEVRPLLSEGKVSAGKAILEVKG